MNAAIRQLALQAAGLPQGARHRGAVSATPRAHQLGLAGHVRDKALTVTQMFLEQARDQIVRHPALPRERGRGVAPQQAVGGIQEQQQRHHGE